MCTVKRNHSDPKIIIACVGSAGGAFVANLVHMGISPLNCRLSISKSRDTSKSTYADKKIVFTLPDNVIPTAEMWRRAMREQRTKIVDIIKGADILLILTGLGDEFNSAVTMTLSDIARYGNVTPVIIASTPFEFEREPRRIYLSSVQQLLRFNGTIFTISNDHTAKGLDGCNRLADALSATDGQIARAVEGIICACNRKQSYSLDRDDAIRFFEKGGCSYFGIGYGSGEDKAKQALQSALESINSSGKVRNSRRVVYYVECGIDASFDELSWIATNIVKEVAPNAELSMSVKFDHDVANAIRIAVYCMDCQEDNIA